MFRQILLAEQTLWLNHMDIFNGLQNSTCMGYPHSEMIFAVKCPYWKGMIESLRISPKSMASWIAMWTMLSLTLIDVERDTSMCKGGHCWSFDNISNVVPCHYWPSWSGTELSFETFCGLFWHDTFKAKSTIALWISQHERIPALGASTVAKSCCSCCLSIKSLAHP